MTGSERHEDVDSALYGRMGGRTHKWTIVEIVLVCTIEDVGDAIRRSQ